MKKIVLLLTVIVLAASTAMGGDIKDLLKKAASNKGNAKEAITGALSQVLSTSKLDVSSLKGSWAYQGPAVSFKSDNVLKKAGGAAASEAIIKKIQPFYKAVGFNNMTMTVADSTFSMKVRGITIKGTLRAITDSKTGANFVMNITAGKRTLKQMEVYVEKSVNGNIRMMFDISKLISLVETFGKVANNSTINSAVKLLKSYDGLCAGFELKQTAK